MPFVGIGTPPPPTPHPQASVPPPPCFWGEGNARWRERGWESPNSDEGHTLWYSLYVRTLWYSYGNAAHSAVYSTKLYTVYEIKYQVLYEYIILNFLDLLIHEVHRNEHVIFPVCLSDPLPPPPPCIVQAVALRCLGYPFIDRGGTFCMSREELTS